MPLPDLSKEMREIEEENNAPVEQNVQMSVEPVEEKLTEEEIFKKQKREKLLKTLEKARAKSAEVRKQRKAEKQANKKPRGRPKKTDLVEKVEELDDGTQVKYAVNPEPEPQPEPTRPEPEPLPSRQEMEKNVYTPVTIDYDRIINGVHQKYMSSKEIRRKQKAEAAMRKEEEKKKLQLQQDYEKKIRIDERTRIQAEVNKRKQEEIMKQKTQDYYSKLPPRRLATGNKWDDLFN